GRRTQHPGPWYAVLAKGHRKGKIGPPAKSRRILPDATKDRVGIEAQMFGISAQEADRVSRTGKLLRASRFESRKIGGFDLESFSNLREIEAKRLPPPPQRIADQILARRVPPTLPPTFSTRTFNS